MLTVNPTQAIELIEDCLFNPTNRVVPILKGAPGTGKSSIYRAIATARNLKFIDIRLAQADPTDLSGLPDLAGAKATYKPFDIFPLKGDALPLKPEFESKQNEYNVLLQTGADVSQFQAEYCYAGWLVLFDELPDASRAVQSAAYRVILDRQVGMYDLHDACYCAAAGNRLEDKAGVGARMSTALQSRMVHLNMGLDKDGWIKWAIDSGFKARITSFIEFKPEYLNKFDPNHSHDTFSCQRTLEFLHNVTNHMDTIPDSKLPLLAGCISEPVARDFMNFIKFYQGLPKYEEIVANPHGMDLPQEAGIRYAMVGMLASNVTKETLTECLTYVDRLSSDFRLVFIRQAYARNKLLVAVPAFMARVREIRDLITD